MERIVISCLESRIETDRSVYARFLLGPFKDDAVTIATALRRSLLSKVKSIAITAIHIQGITHEFSTIVGVRESVLDLSLNFQQVILRLKTNGQAKRFSKRLKADLSKTENLSTFRKIESDQRSKSKDLKFEKSSKQQNVEPIGFGEKDKTFMYPNVTQASTFGENTSLSETVEIGYLQMQGPAVIYANDLKLPAGIECVDPTQYIATLSAEGSLVVKFLIGGKKASFNNNAGKLTGNQLVINTFNKERSSLGSDNLLFTKRLVDNLRLNNASNTLTDYLNRVPVEPKPSNISRSRSRQFTDFDNLLDPITCLRHTIFLDPIFDSVFQANYIIEKDDLFNQPRERIVLELWTNGSVHPRQALHTASLSLISTFSVFRKWFQLDSL